MVKALALAMAASGAESDGSDDSERYGGGRGSRDPDRVSTKDLPKWTKDFKQPKLILVDPDSEDLSSSICVLPPVYCPMPALTHDACMVPLPSLLVPPRAESVPIPSELLA